MKKHVAPVLVIVAAGWLAGVAEAAPVDKETVKLDRSAIVAGSVIPAGVYRLDLAAGGETVRFLKGKRTVAEAPCKVGLAHVVYAGNAVTYRTGEGAQDRLIKIVLAGSRLAIDFPGDAAGAPDASIANASDRP
jgi:hypothetical protein